MFRAIFFILPISYLVIVNAMGPAYYPTKGEVWPKPRKQNRTTIVYRVNFEHLKIEISKNSKSCHLLEKAIERYTKLIKHQMRPIDVVARVKDQPLHSKSYETIKSISVILLKDCEVYPHFEMVEKYRVKVASGSKSKIISHSIWGILRGLETLSQLFYSSNRTNDVLIGQTEISDSPLYSHRGLLIDTGRHFVSKKTIFKILDGMEANKLNVLHWHFVDDQSFPYVSKKFPELSEKGAYHPRAVYTHEDVKNTLAYATERGIRIVPEFDVPGHASSWGASHPELLTDCGDFSPMNPVRDTTYKFIKELLQEITEVFPDDFLHLGGDEVNYTCWSKDKEIKEYMSKHNITNVKELQSIFTRRLLELFPKKRNIILWEDVLSMRAGVTNNSNTFIQSWLNNAKPIISKGYQVINSHGWYLDHLDNGGDWESFYDYDVPDGLRGGEACMWGESVDDTNIITRIFPRVNAVAERLWSHSASKKVNTETQQRMDEHACRLNARGIPAQPPNGPSYCPYVYMLN